MRKPRDQTGAAQVAIREAPSPRLFTIEALRGLAALAVVWFHCTNGHPPGLVKSSGAYGFLGVEVFFVISAFIIPYSLHQSHYRPRFFGRFLLRRMIRLEPPCCPPLSLVIPRHVSAALPTRSSS